VGIVENNLLGHNEVYIVSPQLKEGLRVALIDSGIKEISKVTRNHRKTNEGKGSG
jgi:hypothetical protein